MNNNQFPEDFNPSGQEEDSALFPEEEALDILPDDTQEDAFLVEEALSEGSEADFPLPTELPPGEEAQPLDQELMELNQLLEEPTAQPEEPEPQPEIPPAPQKKAEPERPVRKGRPRRKKGEGFLGIPNILVTAIWLAITVAIGVTLGRMLWVCAADVLAFGREDKSVTITIYETDTIDDIAAKLHNANLIRYPGLFKLYASFAVDEGEIRPGIWDLNTLYDYHALVKMMSPGSTRKVIEIMIPEGYSCRQIFALLEENKVCTAKDLAAYAATGELDEYWFLEDVERGGENSLEGFLFPDTYQFYTNDTPRNVLQKMLNNFDNRFTQEMRDQLPILNETISEMMRSDGRSQEYIDAHQLTLREVVIVASLIEKETASAEESYSIASVIYNRLFRWGDNPAYLGIDASIVYALGGKTELTSEDLQVDSPYNTRTHTGLTPGPIANPGLASLKAALEPKDTPYYYYVLDTALGVHHFSKTYEEHQTFIASQGG